MESLYVKRTMNTEKRQKNIEPAECESVDNLNKLEPSPKRICIKNQSDDKETETNIDVEKRKNKKKEKAKGKIIDEEFIRLKTLLIETAYLNDDAVKLKSLLKEKSRLNNEELIKLKKLLITKPKQPKFILKDYGRWAHLNIDMENRVPLFLTDIQNLLLFSQFGLTSPYSPHRWCFLEKQNHLVHTCMLIVENISVDDFLGNKSLFPFISTTFDNKFEVLNPRAYKRDIVQDINMVSLTRNQMRMLTFEHRSLEAACQTDEVFDLVKNMFPVEDNTINDTALPKTDKFPRTHLLLSGWQMVEENFPLPIKGLMETKYVDYVLTKDVYKDVTPTSPMYGLDCEMCRTTTGDLELTRISIVNEQLEEFYEELVMPDNKITDYLTRFSGITSKMMKNVKKKLKDVQEDIRRMLPADAILVGQSLSNDMHALKMMHPYIIDSSIVFNITGERSRKTKLQTLAREFLNERIQEGSRGHCSYEDSAASLKLVQLKLAQSLYYGDAVMSNIQTQVTHYPELGNPNYATSFLKRLSKLSNKSALVAALGGTAIRYRYYTYKNSDEKNKRIKIFSKKTNEAIIQKLCESVRDYSLNIGHVKPSEYECDETIAFKNVDNWVKEIYEHSLPRSLHIIIFGGLQDDVNGCCFIQIKKS